MTLALPLFLIAAIAGFIDAIAGGGGLLTVPALLLTGIDAHHALGTNKGQSVFGSATSLWRFARSPLLDRRRALCSFLLGLAGGATGVSLVTRIKPGILTPLVMVLLLLATVLVIVRKPSPQGDHPIDRSLGWAAAVALLLGAYDGFFGPGVGTFLIIAYAWLWHDPLDAASANAKVVNFASNLAAMTAFAIHGLIVWRLAVPMAAGQVIGGYLGAHVTIRAGRGLVRYAVAAVSLALVARLAWGLLR